MQFESGRPYQWVDTDDVAICSAASTSSCGVDGDDRRLGRELDLDQPRVLSGEDPFDEATTIDDGQTPLLAEHPLPGHPAQPVK